MPGINTTFIVCFRHFVFYGKLGRFQNASDLIHDVIGEAFRAAKLANYTRALDEMEKPERWQSTFGSYL